MNSLELIEHRLVMSMFVDNHRPERRYMTRQDFQIDYYTDVETRLFNSIVTDLRKQGLVKATPQGGTYAVRLRSDAYNAALARLLSALQADTLEVDWETKRILTDAEERDQDSLIPCPNGWMLLTCEKKGTATKAAPADPRSPASVEMAARDVNHFYGPVHGHGVNNQVEEGRENWWSRWGTIFGGVSALLAVAALIAAWYFWRYPQP